MVMTPRKRTPPAVRVPAPEPVPLTPEQQAARDAEREKFITGWRHRRFVEKLAATVESLRDAADEVERQARRVERIEPTTTVEELGLDFRKESYTNIASQVANTVTWMVPNMHLESLAADAAYADAARIVPTTEES